MSNKTQNRVSALLKVALAASVVIAIAQFAVAQLVLDDFSTGAYQKTLTSGADTNIQYGSMVGDSRETTLNMCPPAQCNAHGLAFNQPTSFQIKGKTKSAPAALVYSSGYKTDGYLGVFYGKSTPLNLDLASSYDRIRLNFDGADEFVNFDIVVYTNGLYSASGCNLADRTYGKPFSVDFPFTDFTPGNGVAGADFRDLTQIALLFADSEGPHGGEDFAVTSVEAIPTGAPKADITCHGYAK
ncbi:MAG: hypothetical protein WB762_14355 [Candidatus Sulfotelmatobacter sp.]